MVGQPLHLLMVERTSRLGRNSGVHESHAHTGHLDPEIDVVETLIEIRIVVAADDVQSIAERAAVTRLEGGELGVGAERGEITLDEDRERVDGRHLAARLFVHQLGMA